MGNKTLELDVPVPGLATCYVEVRHHTASTFLDSLAAATFAVLPITFPAVTEDADRPGVYQAVISGAMDDGVYPWRMFQRVGASQDRTVDTLLGGGVLNVEDNAEVSTTVEGTITEKDIFRGLLALISGKTTGANTGTIKYRNVANTKDRLTITVDNSGNRSTVTLDGSD